MARKSRKTTEAISESPMIAKNIYYAGAYVRLSAIDRKQKGDSIETQQAIISAFILEQSDIVLRETYIDNGTSGTTFERPAFQQMLTDAEKGKINCLITKDLSRLGRNSIDTGFYIEKYFPTHNLRFIAINDDYDSTETQSGGVMVSLKNMINETYALEIGRKIRATKQMNIRDGAFIGRFPPYGYLKKLEDSHKLVIDSEAATHILRIYEMAASGERVSVIVKQLNDAGILPPRQYFRTKGFLSEKEKDGHKHWNKGAIYSILHNRIYRGDMVQGKFKTINHVETKLPASEWVVTENTHKAIVSPDLWEQIQALWDSEGKKKKTVHSENIFLRKIFCAHCGYTMRRVRSGKTGYGFTCETRTIYDKTDCVQVSVNENTLKKILLFMLRKHTGEYSSVPSTANPSETESAALDTVRQELLKNSGFLKKLYESLMLNDITPEEYREMKQSYETKIEKMTEQEQDLCDTIRGQLIQMAQQRSALGCIGGIRHIQDFTAENINSLVARIEVFENKHIGVKFQFTDEIYIGSEVDCND